MFFLFYNNERRNCDKYICFYKIEVIGLTKIFVLHKIIFQIELSSPQISK